MALKDNYNQTLNASYLGYVVQAVVNNFAPLLFLTFQKSYGISLARIAMLSLRWTCCRRGLWTGLDTGHALWRLMCSLPWGWPG